MDGPSPSGFTDFQGSSASAAGIALSRAAPAGAAELDQSPLGETDTGRKAKFYSLTGPDRAQLEKELGQLDRLSAAIGPGGRGERGVTSMRWTNNLRLRLRSLFHRDVSTSS